MKKQIFSAIIVAGLFFSTGYQASAQLQGAVAVKTEKSSKAASSTYKVDVAQSKMTWNGKKVVGEHNGTINLANGTLQVDKNKVTGGTVEVDMTSLVNLDLTDKEYNQKLVGHLKSDDFFSVEKHPRATFKITNVSPITGAKAGAPNYNVKGNLTIKGITKPVTFPATITVNNNTITAKSEAVTIDRTQYDIRYGSKSFFGDLGDKAINDEFTVGFDLVAKKSNLVATK